MPATLLGGEWGGAGKGLSAVDLASRRELTCGARPLPVEPGALFLLLGRN